MSSLHKNQEILIFGLDNKTDNHFSIMVIKEPKDDIEIEREDAIDFYISLYIEAQGYLEYRSLVPMPERRVVIYAGDEEQESEKLWDITDDVVYGYQTKDMQEDLLEASIDELKKSAFVIQYNAQHNFELINRFTKERIKPIQLT